MTEVNLFSQEDGDQVNIDESKNYLEELVGEGKKFKSPEDLAKGKAYSDAHIALLEKRFDELRADYLKQREELTAGAKLQELLDKLETTQASRIETHEPNDNAKPELDLTQVESLVSSKIQQHEQTRREEENSIKVMAKLKERLGNNYKDILKSQSDALGLSEEDVNLMAKKNPNLFFKTFDLDKVTTSDGFQAPPRSDKKSEFAPKVGEKRTWSYYLKLKEKDPRAWLDTKIAIQMEKDAQALGKDFYDI
jgi:hypothetical protein